MIAFLLGVLLLEATSEAEIVAPALFPRGLLVDGDIVNGTEEVLYVAIIQYEGRSICGGAIIAENKVLTSAHCVMKYRKEKQKFRVRVATRERDPKVGSLLIITDVKLHESFTETQGNMSSNEHQVPINDLAMIIAKPMDFPTPKTAISLYSGAKEVKFGDDGFVTGWRKINGKELLATRNVNIRFVAECNTAYHESVPAGQICASYPGPDETHACLGDLGGPLVIGGQLAGILSWGNECAMPDHDYGLYTSIYFYRDWIDNNGTDIRRLP